MVTIPSRKNGDDWGIVYGIVVPTSVTLEEFDHTPSPVDQYICPELVSRAYMIIYFHVLSCVLIYVHMFSYVIRCNHMVPVVPHKAVAEVSKIGKL